MNACEYCKIIEEKTGILFEDDKLIAIIPEKPLLKGHIKIIPKEHHACFQDINDKDVEHLFYAASFAATALFENLEAHGTNILANTGNAHNKEGHFHLDVLARKMDDGINLMWTPNKMPEPELKEVAEKIKDKCDMIGITEKKEVINLDKKPEKLESTEEKASSDKQDRDKSGDSEKKPLPSEEEQKYEKADKKQSKPEKKEKEDKESYLIKQLRRMP